MDILKTLTPTETYYLLNHPLVKVKSLARLAFSDLLLKSVLKLELRAEEVTTKKTDTSFVVRGTKFNAYKPLKHETIFTDYFATEDVPPISLQDLIKKAYESIRSTDYKYYYVYSSRVAPYFSNNIIYRGMGIHVLNTNGKKLQKEMRVYFNTMSQQIKEKQSYLEQVAQKLLPIRGNILLLQHLDAPLFEALHQMQLKKSEEEEDYDFRLFHDTSLEERKEFDPTGVMELVEEIFDGIGDSSSDFSSGDSDSGGGDGGGSD